MSAFQNNLLLIATLTALSPVNFSEVPTVVNKKLLGCVHILYDLTATTLGQKRVAEVFPVYSSSVPVRSLLSQRHKIITAKYLTIACAAYSIYDYTLTVSYTTKV